MKCSYWIELPRNKAELYKMFLKALNVKYEASECYNFIHISVYSTPEQEKIISVFETHLEELWEVKR